MLDKKYSPIPQNEKSFFIIEKGDWSSSINITYRHHEKINMLYLFAILKSYALRDEHALKFILTMSQIEIGDRKTFTYTKISINKIKRIDFLDFIDYYDELQDKEYQYISTHEFYGFKILFFNESIFWKRNLIFPTYPWDHYIKNNIIDKNLKYLDKFFTK